jgi:aminoglycoside phosphotransferase (APT) family kinase protein
MKAKQTVDYPGGIASACKRIFGAQARVENPRQLTAGASAATWLFEVVSGAEKLSRIAQLFTGEHQFSASLDKNTQGKVQQAAFEAGVPTPRVDGFFQPGDGVGEGFISEFKKGETLGHRIVKDPDLAQARVAMRGQCGEVLARIHAIPLEQVPALPSRQAREMVLALRDTHDLYAQQLPVFEVAFRWLEEHAPPIDQPRLVHGDFRNGNFIVDPSGIVAVLDWEAAHLGDPMEDLGWLCMNAWRFGKIDKPVGGFGERAELYSAYQAVSGIAVDPARVRYWEVFGNLKWGVICQWFAQQFETGEVRTLERAAIGHRVSEVELDLLDLLQEVL